MLTYTLQRLALMVPTLFGILLINFLIIQAAPGGPVDRTLAHLQGIGGSSVMSSQGDIAVSSSTSGHGYRGSQGLDPELIAAIEKQYGFDQPPAQRFWKMLNDFARFDLGNSL